MTDIQPPKFKRSARNILVLPKVQITFLVFPICMGVTLIGCYSFFIYSQLNSLYRMFFSSEQFSGEAQNSVSHMLAVTVFELGAFSLLFLASMILVVILLSHRVAGPLVHFRRVFKQISEGNLQARVRLRKRDELHDMADEFNKMMDILIDAKR